VTINRVMTDNGSDYRPYLSLTSCHSLVAKPIKTKPYTPRTNDMAERFIYISLREWAYKQAYESSVERATALLSWLQGYNHRRPPASLNNRPQIS
jgi:transposase InsO family protein